MKTVFVAIGIGTVLIIFGGIFMLQGESIVGPSTSFMYSNPQWITNGQLIVLGGIIIFVSSILISLRHPKS